MGKITVADYLVQELYNLGILNVFGLPGDYNFNLIDAVEKHPFVQWIGCTNELNSGYAADGYARVKGFGACLTTFAVGELSAINAIAGCYAENVPVIKIVGAPATKYIKENKLIHHNFMPPDYFAFMNAYYNVTQAVTFLNAENAKEEIDRILSVFIKYRKPVYIAIPADIALMEIDNKPDIKKPESNKQSLEKAVEHALALIKNSKNPVILGDVLIKRFNAVKSFNKLINKSGFPAATLIMGKGLIPEEGAGSEFFMGTYLGHYENPNVYKRVNNSDCVITLGAILSDFNTLGFDMEFEPDDFINAQASHTVVQKKVYEEVLLDDFIEKLADKIEHRDCEIHKNKPNLKTCEEATDEKLSFSYILPRFEQFLKKDDMLFIDTGLSEFAGASWTLPEGAVLYNQFLWASIGWATPAAFGGASADRTKRVILFTGEGSHQLTAQSLSNIMFRKLKPIIIVVNNRGYTIERILSDNPEDKYNDITEWQYTKLPEVFEGCARTAQARTNREFDEVLKFAEIENQKGKHGQMCYIEIFTDKMDIPDLMRNYIETRKKEEG